ncbi:M23 family metallopeptidase, partial [bacterium]|nr:M23 family metallopeptidase [candidate division CSSED10-310 bacterium]
GDTLARVLDLNGISAAGAHSIAAAVGEHLALNSIRPGTTLTLTYMGQEERLERILMRTDQDHELVLRREDDAWHGELRDIHSEIDQQLAEGTISSSFWLAAEAAGVAPAMILDVADMFGWQIDFACDLRNGDAFKILHEIKHYSDGSQASGNILAAKFTNKGDEFLAFRFAREDSGDDFYDSAGNSLRRTFLKSPLRYRYISSGFSHSRFHPILKKYRPHLGVDYAAPSGTPVSALGDGIIVFKGTNGGYGKYLQVRHGDAYLTCYGHLSGYAKGIAKGARVKQGQVIGYVGATGLATGPHLDFRVKYRDSFINPLSLDSPPAEPLPEALMDDFITHRDRCLEAMGESIG